MDIRDFNKRIEPVRKKKRIRWKLSKLIFIARITTPRVLRLYSLFANPPLTAVVSVSTLSWAQINRSPL